MVGQSHGILAMALQLLFFIRQKMQLLPVQFLSPAIKAGPREPSYSYQLPRGVREVHLMPLQSVVQGTGHGQGDHLDRGPTLSLLG